LRHLYNCIAKSVDGTSNRYLLRTESGRLVESPYVNGL